MRQIVVFAKSHVKGYVKKNGVFVKEHTNKTVKKVPPVQYGLFGGKLIDDAQHPPPEGVHPKLGSNGKKVLIDVLSVATPVESFVRQEKIATVLPGGDMPASLNGVEFLPWFDVPTRRNEWANVEGQTRLNEPKLKEVEGKKISAGVVIKERDGRVWVIHPTNQFGGYKTTFPKGTVEDGLSLQATAIKEAYEESGLKVEITGHLMDVERTTSVARFYTAKRVGGTPSDCGWESQAVSLVPVKKLHRLLNMKGDYSLLDKIKDE